MRNQRVSTAKVLRAIVALGRTARLPGRSRLVLVLVSASLLACLGLAGGAFAFWASAGTGGGSGAAGSALAMSVGAGTPGVGLYPGGQTDVALVISNPNPFAAHVGSLALDPSQGTAGFSVDGGHSGCAVSSLSFSTQTNGGPGWSVPPKVGVTNGSLSLDLAGSLAMSAGASGACQGATFTVYLIAGP